MACSNKPGPAAFRHFIEQTMNQKISQREWHQLKKLAEEETGGRLSRARVDADRTEQAASALTNVVDYEGGFQFDNADDERHFGKHERELFAALDGTTNTEGTIGIINYLNRHGIEDTLESMRKKDEAPVASSASVVEPNDSDDYASRVRALEEEGIPTSDAQGMVDAEDMLRAKAEKGAYGKANVGGKYTGYRDAAEISKDVRADIKAMVKEGELPVDLKAAVKTSKYSGGQAVDVRLSGWAPERVWTKEPDAYGMEFWRYTPEAEAVRERVELARSAYNRNASEPQVDYFDNTYYGNVSWDVPAPRD